MESQHSYFLQQALTLARLRKGYTASNPAVGAIIGKEGKILATGYHQGSGHPHAEVDALTKLGDEAVGATLYVTLEPCCHWGKTPPCTSLIIERRLAKVVYGYKDPNPIVNGQGQGALQAAGIVIEHYPLAEIDEFYTSYAYWQKNHRPYVIAKLAMSLDSKIADANGEPLAITGQQARVFTHQGRNNADAILTTARTIIADDPQLNVRLADQVFSKPLYILDQHLSIPLSAQIFRTAERVTLLHGAQADVTKRALLADKGYRCCLIPSNHGYLDLAAVLECLGKEGFHELWVEAGGKCITSLIKECLVNKLILYIAPIIIGESAKTAFHLADYDLAKKALAIQWNALGRDGICEILLK